MSENLLKKSFDIVCILELVSCVMLFLIAMPMKYIGGNDALIRPFGSIHGFLFVLYFVMAFVVRKYYQWNLKEFSIVLLYAVIPFCTWFVHKKINKYREETVRVD